MTTPIQPTLQGTYISQSNVSLPFEAYVLPDDDKVIIGFSNGQSKAIFDLFPAGRGGSFSVTRGAFNKFKENVINKDVDWKPIIKTNTETYKTITIPGRWTSEVMSETTGGRKRSGRNKRSGKSGRNKRSGKSGRKRSGKKSGHKKRNHKSRHRNSRCTTHRR